MYNIDSFKKGTNNMEFRKAKHTDLESIMNIIIEAQCFLKEQGINQWQNGYPNSSIITSDIEAGNSYMLLHNNTIVATAALSFNGEPTYDTIYDGSWLSEVPYAVIHRIAVAKDVKGKSLSSTLIQFIEELCLQHNRISIKIDTHEDNKLMQKVILKNKFQYCGIIYLKDKNKRLAFEKILVN